MASGCGSDQDFPVRKERITDVMCPKCLWHGEFANKIVKTYTIDK